jgi:hypothetical protein
MFKTIRNFLGLVAISLTFQAHAAVSPISLGIVRPLQFPPEDFTVTGARISVLWGEHRNMYGLDLGLLGNITEQEFKGLAISGVFNITEGQTTIIGLQLAGLTNFNTNKIDVVGFQLAAGLNMNEAASSVSGLQAALLANIAPYTDIYGLQVGLYNRALDVHGLQLGLVNVTDSLHGFQIGLINFNHKGTFVVSPILNAGF